MKTTTVIYHSADFDGLFCREIARKFLGDENVEYIGWDHGNGVLPIPEGGTIYVLDLPVDRVFGYDFSRDPVKWFAIANTELIWIDHHKSAIETHPGDIPGYRIDGVAACRLAWQWFYLHTAPATIWRDKTGYVERRVTEPLAVRLAGEYDVWDKRDPDAEVFQFALRSRELGDDDWRGMLSVALPHIPDVVVELFQNGRLLQRYQQRTDAGMLHRSFLVDWAGLKFLALNTARCNSLTFAAKDVPETGHDALMGFYFDGGKWNFSLYHARHRTDLDLSALAIKRGGGGHRGACGFQTKEWILA